MTSHREALVAEMRAVYTELADGGYAWWHPCEHPERPWDRNTLMFHPFYPGGRCNGCYISAVMHYNALDPLDDEEFIMARWLHLAINHLRPDHDHDHDNSKENT